ncbi:MAG TPA: sterol desaturase family protein [Stellaceae bacterium]|nr:sterol desaturase family protein [Stellaceae bacterium]
MAFLTNAFAVLPATSFLVLLTVFAVGALIERVAPVRAPQLIADARVNVGYAFFAEFMQHLLDPMIGAVALVVVGSFGGGWIALPNDGWAIAVSAAVFFLATDFLDYLWHRAQHAVPLLWAMHSLHHSDTAMNVTTSTRHFWIEAPIRMMFIYPLVGIVFQVPPVVLIFYGVFKLQDFVQHLNLKLGFGPLWPALSSPQYHRIHHSTRPEHCNRNFAHFLPLFDILFGTHYRPRPGEYPPTGLGTGEVPNLLGAILWPLRHVLRFAPETRS